MLIDGHSSRLDPKFLTYINNCNHQWKVCLGVPYGKSLWKVGDIKEQNGTFKDEWYRAKTSLYEYKGDFNLELKFTQEDVRPLLDHIFKKHTAALSQTSVRYLIVVGIHLTAGFLTIRILLDKTNIMARNKNQSNKLITGQ